MSEVDLLIEVSEFVFGSTIIHLETDSHRVHALGGSSHHRDVVVLITGSAPEVTPIEVVKDHFSMRHEMRANAGFYPKAFGGSHVLAYRSSPPAGRATLSRA